MKNLSWALGALSLLGLAVAPQSASAVLILESVAELGSVNITNLNGDLDGTPNEDPADDLIGDNESDFDRLQVAAVNADLEIDRGDGNGVVDLFTAVDYLGKTDDLGQGAPFAFGDVVPFTLDDAQTISTLSGDVTITADVFSLTCIEVKDDGDCIGIHWEFNNPFTTDWNIVKLGFQADGFMAYFLVDPSLTDASVRNGADSGDIILADLFTQYGLFGEEKCTGRPGSEVCRDNIFAFSHINFFGEAGDAFVTSEPMTLALVGLGLVGLATIRRRVAA